MHLVAVTVTDAQTHIPGCSFGFLGWGPRHRHRHGADGCGGTQECGVSALLWQDGLTYVGVGSGDAPAIQATNTQAQAATLSCGGPDGPLPNVGGFHMRYPPAHAIWASELSRWHLFKAVLLPETVRERRPCTGRKQAADGENLTRGGKVLQNTTTVGLARLALPIPCKRQTVWAMADPSFGLPWPMRGHLCPL